jgi:hypothetical protein
MSVSKEIFKRKLAKRIQAALHLSPQYGDEHAAERSLWEAIKYSGWRGRRLYGWYDKAFRKKLNNARVRQQQALYCGNYYRKIFSSRSVERMSLLC